MFHSSLNILLIYYLAVSHAQRLKEFDECDRNYHLEKLINTIELNKACFFS
jgi:hypothetical protein